MMKLGSQTASLSNHLLSRAVIGEPEVKAGMGVTFLSWTDRNPGTIFRVMKVGKATIIECRDDDYKRIDKNGMSESQEYEYKIRPNGGKSFFRKNEKSGFWERVTKNESTGRWNKSNSGCGIRIGEREKYHDFSF